LAFGLTMLMLMGVRTPDCRAEFGFERLALLLIIRLELQHILLVSLARASTLTLRQWCSFFGQEKVQIYSRHGAQLGFGHFAGVGVHVQVMGLELDQVGEHHVVAMGMPGVRLAVRMFAEVVALLQMPEQRIIVAEVLVRLTQRTASMLVQEMHIELVVGVVGHIAELTKRMAARSRTFPTRAEMLGQFITAIQRALVHEHLAIHHTRIAQIALVTAFQVSLQRLHVRITRVAFTFAVAVVLVAHHAVQGPQLLEVIHEHLLVLLEVDIDLVVVEQGRRGREVVGGVEAILVGGEDDVGPGGLAEGTLPIGRLRLVFSFLGIVVVVVVGARSLLAVLSFLVFLGLATTATITRWLFRRQEQAHTQRAGRTDGVRVLAVGHRILSDLVEAQQTLVGRGRRVGKGAFGLVSTRHDDDARLGQGRGRVAANLGHESGGGGGRSILAGRTLATTSASSALFAVG